MPSIEIKGLDQVFQNLEELDSRIKQKMAPALQKCGTILKDSAYDKAPEKTGFLKSRIFIEINGMNLELGCDCPYAIYQELIWNPFLQPAIMENSNEITEILKDAYTNACRKTGEGSF